MVISSDAAAAKNDFTKLATDSALQQYSIKLGELVPELLDFKAVDSKLLLSLGLEI